MRSIQQMACLALSIAVAGYLAGNVIGAPTYNNCVQNCWEGTLYYTTATYCDQFSSTQAAPSIRCGGSCFTGNPAVDTGTVTRTVGECDNDCSNVDPSDGTPREGANYHDTYMTFDPEAKKKCPRGGN